MCCKVSGNFILDRSANPVKRQVWLGRPAIALQHCLYTIDYKISLGYTMGQIPRLQTHEPLEEEGTMKQKRHSWRGRAVSATVNGAIFLAIAYALAEMWRMPLLPLLGVAAVATIIATGFTWWIAEHPNDPWGRGHHPGRWQ